ncbi:MAG TPA: VWA domain-containing protein [Candidatus Angelobacter sp.]|jgi:VWFA-related protein|nr:VWA domain-containing protein [Candidatus Angelobacter sp.]
MSGFGSGTRNLALFILVAGLSVWAQQPEIPDAPTPKPPDPSGFPAGTPPAPKNAHTPEETQPANPIAVPDGQQLPEGTSGSREELIKFSVSVNFVQVPVTVRDNAGHLVPGLSYHDFVVFEDGVPQKLSYFTSDPFPLSVAVVVDTNVSATTMKKINESLPALVGAFSEFDEVSLFRYGNTVQEISTFLGAGSIPTAALQRLKRTGREGGPPVVGGPMGSGQTVNGHPVDNGAPQVYVPPKESHVLNDAILRAAQALSRREKVRRRIIFVISDGHETGSTASYDEVRKVLLSNNISVYGLGVDAASYPIYDTLNRIRIPGLGYGNILPKYVVDTGGELVAEFDRQAIEQAYAKITEIARNQYTLGYNTKSSPSSTYRSIVVNVHRPDLQVRTKDGYFPLPFAGQAK